MGNHKSKAAGKFNNVSNAVQATVQSKGAAGLGHINIQMVQNVLLIWLDSNIDNNSDDCRNTMMQLRACRQQYSYTFTDGDRMCTIFGRYEPRKGMYDHFWGTWSTYCTCST